MKQLAQSKTITIAFSLLLFFLSVFSYAYFFLKTSTPKEVLGETTSINAVVFWREFLKSHPDYFPGWIELAKLQYKEGDLKGASYSIQKAKKINPNALQFENFSFN